MAYKKKSIYKVKSNWKKTPEEVEEERRQAKADSEMMEKAIVEADRREAEKQKANGMVSHSPDAKENNKESIRTPVRDSTISIYIPEPTCDINFSHCESKCENFGSCYGYSRIPNKLLHKLMCSNLTMWEFRVLLYVLREVLGYTDRLWHTRSNQEFSSFTKLCSKYVGIRNDKVRKVLLTLEDKGWIKKYPYTKDGNDYSYIVLSNISSYKFKNDNKPRPFYFS